jgi:hypothetical protein
MNENLRTVKKKQDNEWITVRLSDIEVGDTFIMFDDDTQVGGEWLAESAPSVQDAVWGIVAKELV